jgi:hypothetical protein
MPACFPTFLRLFQVEPIRDPAYLSACALAARRSRGDTCIAPTHSGRTTCSVRACERVGTTYRQRQSGIYLARAQCGVDQYTAVLVSVIAMSTCSGISERDVGRRRDQHHRYHPASSESSSIIRFISIAEIISISEEESRNRLALADPKRHAVCDTMRCMHVQHAATSRQLDKHG